MAGNLESGNGDSLGDERHRMEPAHYILATPIRNAVARLPI